MRCVYCDTMPDSYKELSIDEVLNEIATSASGGLAMTNSVSLTGGEPLIHASFLKLLLKELKTLGLETYLETNGTLHGALNKVMGMVDIIAMDVKLPSSTKDRPFWNEHEKFLKIARDRDVFIKVVVTGSTKKDEFEQAVRIVHGVDPAIPLVIQPLTPCNGVRKVSLVKLDNFYNYGSSMLKDVRIIPQVHKIIGYR